MSAWVTVPCLLALRDEFNLVNPQRDKGADGTIGDSSHTSSSDHTPDEDSDVLRNKDADEKNEVHGLDIDSSGPWPGGPEWFDSTLKGIVTDHRAGRNDRLQNVIWNGRIASASWDWAWRAYGGSDPHTNHAHFSARYVTEQENDTSSWGVYEEEDMGLTAADREFMTNLLAPVTKALRAGLANDSLIREPLMELDEKALENFLWDGIHALREDVVYVEAPEEGKDSKKQMRGRRDILMIMLRAALQANVLDDGSDTSPYKNTRPPLPLSAG